MASTYGGYDYSFISEDLEKFACNACSKVLRDPHLTECCGQEFCESCLQNWFTKEGKKSCPLCHAEGEKFSTTLDKKLQREIDSLKIHCTNKEEGCQWVGEVRSLKDHLESDNGCNHSYVEMKCPNGCEEMKTMDAKKIESKELEHYLQNECDLMSYKCIHCGYEDTYEAITGGSGAYSMIDLCHYDECPEFPLECPHSCGAKDIKRKDMEVHRSQCPEEEVECPNECEPLKSDLQGGQATRGKYKRKDLVKHLEKECELRPYQCEHCGLKDTYFCTVLHYSTCPEFPIKCPNSCSVKDIKRKDMEDHRSQCPEELVQCPFAEVGCDRHLLQRKLKQHMSTTQQQHLLMVMGAYKEVKKDNEKMEKAYEEVKHELQQAKQDNVQMKTELEQIKKRLIEKKIIRNK